MYFLGWSQHYALIAHIKRTNVSNFELILQLDICCLACDQRCHCTFVPAMMHVMRLKLDHDMSGFHIVSHGTILIQFTEPVYGEDMCHTYNLGASHERPWITMGGVVTRLKFSDCAGNKRKYRKWTVYGMFSPVKMRSESQKQVFMAWQVITPHIILWNIMAYPCA